MVTVKYYANLRDVTGLKEDQIPIKHGTISDLIEILVSKYGEKLSNVLFDDGKLRSNVIILINGINIIFKNGIGEKIKNEDSVDIFPPVAGG